MTSLLLQAGFWVSALLLAYVYVGYALIARVASKSLGRPIRQADIEPTVTVIITAYNEEGGILDKLRNVVELDYPADRFDIVVASDASSDDTDRLVQGFMPGRVRLLRIEGRQGKTACQNITVEHATGEILVFTDATTRLEKGVLRALARNFADPEVGCTAGTLVYLGSADNATAQGGTAYWSYELGLRRAESALGSLVGVSGCLYAVRRSAYVPIAPDLISDFVIAMRMRSQGLRTVLEPDAVCFEDTLDRSGQELSMRVRVALRSVHALVRERRFLSLRRFGRFAWQLWSHKLLRYASPFLWLAMLGFNVALADRPPYGVLLAAQLVVLGLGVCGYFFHDRFSRIRILHQAYYFLLTNLASLIAILRYVRGERIVTWRPVR